jgi:hypothetical protein
MGMSRAIGRRQLLPRKYLDAGPGVVGTRADVSNSSHVPISAGMVTLRHIP